MFRKIAKKIACSLLLPTKTKASSRQFQSAKLKLVTDQEDLSVRFLTARCLK